jgi:hypothetical protein
MELAQCQDRSVRACKLRPEHDAEVAAVSDHKTNLSETERRERKVGDD